MVAGSRTDRDRQGRVWSIPAGVPFLPTLAEAMVEGRLIEGWRPLDDPLLLVDATVYLPTRRAARAFAGEVLRAMGRRAALLPAIRTLGDRDEEEVALASGEGLAADLAPIVPAAERLLRLARLVQGWTAAMSEETRRLLGEEDVVLPSSAAEALRMAAELARLIDQIGTEEMPVSAIGAMIERELADGAAGPWAEWWRLTAHFLRIVTAQWPQFLNDSGQQDPAEARNALLDFRIAHYAAHGSTGPVIVAGSNGSIPATARLQAQVARLPLGAVVLPGLDLALPDAVFARLQAAGAERATAASHATLTLPTHPQHGLARLLAGMGRARAEVGELCPVPPARAPRMAALSRALLPAEESAGWSAEGLAGVTDRFAEVTLVEAPSPREEALAIALALRETLETPGRTAALVTPDRTLARRVAAEMCRFRVPIDDSAGTPLAESAAAGLARLALAVALGPPDPVRLAAFAKHPLLDRRSDPDDAMTPEEADRLGRLFELAALRGAIAPPVGGALAEGVLHARLERQDEQHLPDPVRRMGDAEWSALERFGARLDAVIEPLFALREAEFVSLGQAMQALLETLTRAAGTRLAARWASEPGCRALQAMIDEFLALEDDFRLAPADFPDVFAALAADRVVREQSSAHPRIAILGLIEARLIPLDRVILGGLNEGSWPTQGRNDPYLNRPQRAELGLVLPEQRIGQAAHDFVQLSGAPEVIWTRALRSGGAPTVASRFVQRALLLAGPEAEAVRARGARWLALADAMDAPRAPPPVPRPPLPRPPVALRPRKLSVTAVETLIRDPYAIYARDILALRPLPSLVREADPALRGQIHHLVLHRYLTEPTDAPPLQRMMEIAGEEFANHDLPPAVAALWMPRLTAIARGFLRWNEDRAGEVQVTLPELGGRTRLSGSDFVLTARADRIDQMWDGSLAILDYKSGSNPSVTEARRYAPQLALEGLIARQGGFGRGGGVLRPRDEEAEEGGRIAAEIGDLVFVRLRPDEDFRAESIVTGGRKPLAAEEIIDRAESQLRKLIAVYERPETGYRSRVEPVENRVGDYDHLARVRHWAQAGDE